MNRMKLRDDAPADVAATQIEPTVLPEPAVLRLRSVHRAAAELKRGTPVLLRGESPLVLLPAETAGARGLREFAALAAAAPVLLLAPARAAAVLHRPVVPAVPALALRTSPALLDPAALRSMADPTAEQMLPEEATLAGECPDAAPAALALTKLARLLPAVLAAPARPDAAALAQAMHLLSVPALDVLAYPATMAADLARVAEARVPLDGAPDARVVAFRAPDSGIEHLAILVGRPTEAAAPLARIHSECFTGDLLGSLRCDCGAQLRGAIRRMGEEGAGVLLYLAQEGRGIGLVNKLRAYAMQDRGLDTFDANRALGWGVDERNFLVAATMLSELGIHSVRLLTNNPDKVTALAACGVNVVRRESHAFAPNGVNDHYLATKAERFGHLLG
jgi:GTP cyclohydrolase II